MRTLFLLRTRTQTLTCLAMGLALAACSTTDELQSQEPLAAEEAPAEPPPPKPAKTPKAGKPAKTAAGPAKPLTFDHVVDLSKAPQCKPKARRQGDTTAPPTTPGHFEDMGVCSPVAPVLTPPAAATSVSGVINSAGDCAFPGGVVCLYHDGGNSFGRRGLGVGEVQCLFPTADAQRPLLLGFPFQCGQNTSLKQLTAAKQAAAAAAKQGAKASLVCGTNLISLLGACSTHSRCCTNGHLTDPWSRQTEAQKQTRPGFALCPVALTVDCSADGPLFGMRPHAPNDGLKIR